ncbi:TlpA disulfide reductase family protein [Singulisphaera acidiphila]|uniref:Thiol-disulfide isomerase-like thioredoxin n=1 Tax=Singulisphaera acidiphila (strain ATCC BAA-1392 / DSM 18658 / VKM B-2454 / MOB10) TaxID=886293 RepID=L0DBM2_SINAD|nr:TlpA disulfide reductase family protein [Singulisphaera acidiphila]AGA26642.1 thiol-disulfide isomerase-like thioredoxin [Singulisphaera acidiphila DSM 18658]
MTGLGRIVPAGLFLLLAGCGGSAPSIEVTTGPPGSPTVPLGGDAKRSTRLDSSATPKQLFEEATRAADMGNLGGASSLLEEGLKLEPSNREALFMLAAIEQDRASSLDPSKSQRTYLRSADAIRNVRTQFKDLNPAELNLFRVALYNEARVLASQGKAEKAIASLKESIEAGFSNAEVLRSDDAFASLRKEATFPELVKTVEESARTQAKTRVKALFAETKPFAFEFSLPNLEGKTVSSADFRGKVLVVDLWGTWCPPCRREIPHFIELQSKLQAEGVQVVGINYEQVAPEKIKETIANFVKENKISYPCLIGDEKTQERVGGIEGFPTTLFIDRTGKVRAKLVGLFDMDDSISRLGLEELVKTLLTEDTPTSAETP